MPRIVKTKHKGLSDLLYQYDSEGQIYDPSILVGE